MNTYYLIDRGRLIAEVKAGFILPIGLAGKSYAYTDKTISGDPVNAFPCIVSMAKKWARQSEKLDLPTAIDETGMLWHPHFYIDTD